MRADGRRRSAARLGVRLAGVAASGALLAGCWWPQPGAGPDRRAHNGAETAITAASVGSLHQLWSAPTDGPAGDPVTSTAGVHVEGTDLVYGFRTDGTTRWSVPVPNGWADIADFTSVLVDDGRVLAVHEGLEATEWTRDANAGLWLELDAILAVVVGGNSLLGGRFSITGSLLGAMIIQSINTGILLSGFPPEFNLIIKAGIIVMILFIQSPRVRDIALWFGRSGAATASVKQEAK